MAFYPLVSYLTTQPLTHPLNQSSNLTSSVKDILGQLSHLSLLWAPTTSLHTLWSCQFLRDLGLLKPKKHAWVLYVPHRACISSFICEVLLGAVHSSSGKSPKWLLVFLGRFEDRRISWFSPVFYYVPAIFPKGRRWKSCSQIALGRGICARTHAEEKFKHLLRTRAIHDLALVSTTN